jgi:predicted TIM-barrel fold metal-dependent hydrolase
MDRMGIATQMVSVSDPGVTFVGGAQASRLARDINQYAVELIAAHPGRFGAFAVLPLPDVDAAVAEVEYALDTLGLDGVGILSSYDGRFPGQEWFAPVLAALDARGAYVMIHPTAPGANHRPEMPGIPQAAMEFTFDTTRAAASLIWSGALDRYPNIRWALSHAGGTLPFPGYRITAMLDGLTGRHAAALSRFRYYTALSATRPSMAALREVAPVSHVLFGSDFPFGAPLYPAAGDPQPELADSFTDAERRALGRANALELFPRLR